MKYECKECGTIFSAKFDVICPKCGSTDAEVYYKHYQQEKHKIIEPISY
jgi:Zn finger protein HypA/HybF involved in hydrogenase expression